MHSKHRDRKYLQYRGSTNMAANVPDISLLTLIVVIVLTDTLSILFLERLFINDSNVVCAVLVCTSDRTIN